MKFTKWRIAPEHPEAQARLTAAGYPYLVSAVLAGRGVETPEQAAAFLEREQSLTYSPFLMKDMDKAAARIQQALSDGEKIAVFGDYDVDGITATCILVDYLPGGQHRRHKTGITRRRQTGRRLGVRLGNAPFLKFHGGPPPSCRRQKLCRQFHRCKNTLL